MKRLILTDCNLDDPICEFFNVNDIVFDFLPSTLDTPLIDFIAGRGDGFDKIYIFFKLDKFKKLYEEKSQHNNFDDLKRKFVLVNYKEADQLFDLYYEQIDDNLQFFNWLDDNNIYFLNDGRAGKQLKSMLPKSTFITLHDPFLDMCNIHHYITLKDHKPNKNFFCLLQKRRNRGHRDRLWNKLKDRFQDNSICQYHQPEDNMAKFKDLKKDYGPIHYENIDWPGGSIPIQYYNQTYLELTTETLGHIDNDDSFFLTEKTLKPIMMKHPSMILAPMHHLKRVRELGFKTYDDHLDESYDDLPMLDDRIDCIMKNLETIDFKKLYQETEFLRQFNFDRLLYLYGSYKNIFWRNFNIFWQNIK